MKFLQIKKWETPLLPFLLLCGFCLLAVSSSSSFSNWTSGSTTHSTDAYSGTQVLPGNAMGYFVDPTVDNLNYSPGLNEGQSLQLFITSVSPICTYDANTGQSTFMVTVNLAWDYADLTTTNELINVTFAGQTETLDPAGMAVGTGMVVFNDVAGPAYSQLVEAEFAMTTSCNATSLINLIACTPDCVDGSGTVGGNVFNDANNDGADAGASEVGQENVLVEVYDCDGVLVCSVYTNADGNWSCDGLNDAEEYRVEFSTPLQSYLQSSFAGDDNGTNTQFVTAPSCEVDYGVINPADFCQDAPLIAFACYEPGSGVGQPGFAFLNVPYSAAGQGAVSNNYDATVDDIGTVWGVDYQRTTQYLYGATFLKRHSGIADDPSTIYVWDYSTDPTGPTGQFDLQGINPANGGAAIDLGTVNRTNVTGPIQAGAAGDFELPADKDEPNRDLDAYLKVGKMSYGDVALTEDGNTLWVFNLFQKALISVDVSMADATNLPGSLGTVNQYPLSGLSGLPSCTSGELRPWAISFHEGLGYIGLVCDASVSQDRNDLMAFVLSFDPDNIGAGLTTVVSFPLNYNREDLYYEFNGFTVGLVADIPGEWQPWIPRLPNTPDEFELRPIPVLSNIEFSEGGLEIALMDISAHTYGFENYPPVSGVELPLENKISAGDLVHFCENSGAYFAEGSPECPVFDDGQPNPGTGRTDDGLLNNGEFYYHDNFTIDADAPTYILLHGENASGSIEVLPGTNEIVSMAFDPIQAADGGDVNTQGFSVYSTLDGSFVRAYEVVPMVAQTQGKGNGLGEPVLLCDPASIQIGNYAWFDENGDGIQQACEPPLPGLMVKLYRKDGANDPIQIASTETDANGNYYFSSTSADDPNLNWTGTAADTSLQTGEEYFIAFCGDNGFDETDNTVEVDGINYCLTAADMGEGNNPDLNDSDATVQDVAGDMIPAYCTQPGETNTTSHTFDVGFKPAATLSLGSTVFLDNKNDGLQNGADTGIAMVEVQLWDVATGMQVLTDATGMLVTDPTMAATVLTDADGNYLFSNLPPGDYYVVLPTAPASAPLSSNETSSGFMETDPDDNEDNDDEGLQPGGTGTAVSSDTITLTAGMEPLNEPAQGGGQDTISANGFTDENGNMTVDFGFFAPVSVGDTAYVDLDNNGLQSTGDLPLEGVTVTLYDATTGMVVTTDAEGNPVSTMMTNAMGFYEFTNLPPGDYYVVFDISTVTDAAFYDFTTPNAGDDLLDSDADPTTGQTASTGPLESGDMDTSLDVGVICIVEVTVAEPATICSTQSIDLTSGASVTPATLAATWSTPDGSGTFDGGTTFATATTYTPSAADAARGSVTLVLTTDDPDGPCGVVSAMVTFTILKVDCGSFPWDGGN